MRNKAWYILFISLIGYHPAVGDDGIRGRVAAVLRGGILEHAGWALSQQPVTITNTTCERSAGGRHDFYSEGDYWWPDPANPDGPYIQKDGISNPANFTAHRAALIRFSQVVGYLCSAYLLTHQEQYLSHALRHLRAWFIDTATSMNPSLLYAQAIKGKVTGRSVGVIDMIQMMEVAQGVRIMERSSAIGKNDLVKIKEWFSDYLQWVTTHPYGIEESGAKNNHGTCWVMQVAVFAQLVGNDSLLDNCRQRFKTFLLPGQLDKDGRFPLETKRTKPYGYSLFNLDAMATICHILSSSSGDLWDFMLADGRSMRSAVDYMYTYVVRKKDWPFPPDVMYWNNWPVAQPFLLFAYNKYKVKKWFRAWTKLDHYPVTEEVIRNLPVRNPLLWLG